MFVIKLRGKVVWLALSAHIIACSSGGIKHRIVPGLNRFRIRLRIRPRVRLRFCEANQGKPLEKGSNID